MSRAKSGRTLAKARFDIDGQIVLRTWICQAKHKPNHLTADSLRSFPQDTQEFSACHTTHATPRPQPQPRPQRHTMTQHTTNQTTTPTNQHTHTTEAQQHTATSHQVFLMFPSFFPVCSVFPFLSLSFCRLCLFCPFFVSYLVFFLFSPLFPTMCLVSFGVFVYSPCHGFPVKNP